MPQPATTRRTLNRSELAAHHGVSLPQIDTWVRRGCPAIERGSKGTNWKFDPVAVIEWRVKQAVDEVTARFITGDGSMTREEADRRRAIAAMRLAEIEADTADRNAVLRSDVEVDLASFCTELHSGLGSASNRIAGRATSMTSATEIEDLCHTELNRALNGARVALAEKWGKTPGGSSRK